MAEIRVERKPRSTRWMWLVLLLVILVAVAVYLWQAGYVNLSYVEPAVEATWDAMITA